ncbi:MAG: BON domain-containing protein [Proteobacteria bacterium]|nr:BON domain-containing protein [Pseudomonadota bacterium]
MLGLCRSLGACAAVAAGLALAGCSSPTMMLDAATTVAEDRPMSQVMSDAGLKIDINMKLLSNKYRDLFLDVNTNVYENRVMLTGSVETTAEKRRATLLVLGVKGVTKVINELQVTADGSLKDTANDLWIETKLKARLVGADGVSSINYRWRSVNGVVYFIGVAQNQDELAKVIRLARGTSHVNNVVSHVRIQVERGEQ